MSQPPPLGVANDVLAAMDGVTVADWAHHYRTLGLKPLPKKPGAKYPAVDWLPYQTQDPTPTETASWFSNGTDGICLVLDRSPFVVLDCDGERKEARRLLADAGVVIPDACPRVITGRDRDHFWFQTSRAVGRHVAVIRDETVSIDVLGSGVVLAPPSVHPGTGRAYRWEPPFLDRQHVPELPARVFELLGNATRPSQPPLSPVDGPIPEGEREHAVMRILGAARRCGATGLELRALAAAVNQRCRPQLAGQDLDRMARSASRYDVDDLDLPALIASVRTTKSHEPPALQFQTAREMFQTMAEETHTCWPPISFRALRRKWTHRPNSAKPLFVTFSSGVS